MKVGFNFLKTLVRIANNHFMILYFDLIMNLNFKKIIFYVFKNIYKNKHLKNLVNLFVD